MQNHFTRRYFLKATLVTGSALLANSAVPLARRNVYAAKEEFEVPLQNIEVGGIIRPPGALPEKEFRAKCISCGVCVNVCHAMKYDAIAVAGIKDIRNFGTPYIKDMRDFPCALCMECPKHCPTGALKKVEMEKVTMGMALIDLGLCFGWNGDVCLSCSKVCPMGAKIFDFYNGEWGNQPYINENCVGCGLCVKYCPLGGSAIKVVTKRQHENIKASRAGEMNRLLTMSTEERYNIVYDQNLPQIMARGRLIEREYR